MGNFDDAIRLPSAKFPEIGTAVAGTVVEIGRGTVPTFDDKGRVNGTVKLEDGSDKMQVEVTLDTDSGKVMLHTDGAIFYAIGRALAENGAEDLELGDKLTVTYTGDGVATAKGRNAPKQYAATIAK